jgi:hypothetical protein
MSKVVQWTAAIVVLAAFALCQWGRSPAWSYRYLLGNLIGGAGLSAPAFLSRQWGFVLLEGIWALVAARSFLVRLSGRELHIPTA